MSISDQGLPEFASMHVPPKKSEKTRLAKRFLTPAPHENSSRNLLEGAGAKAAYVAGLRR